MQYTVSELAELTGLSKRTLRYYDEIGLFKAQRLQENEYRVYQSEDLDTLSVIMLLRKLDVPLVEIQQLLAETKNTQQLLAEQKAKLLEKQNEIQALINWINQIEQEDTIMSDKKKFEVFKQDMIKDNREHYGEEVIERYGEDALEKAEQHLSHLSELEYQQAKQHEQVIKEKLHLLLENNQEDVNNDEAKAVFNAHSQWLKLMSGQYSKGYHRAMAELYTTDDRFGKYYDDLVGKQGAAELLRHIIEAHTK
ncbi:MerR family transcriptional regulator [Staphylococcus simulans]|uniref:MerR family transcriptional regulator n=1 Tax=Staphylococcus simulans TaxID=1286 RepID=UPI00399ACE2B